MKLREPEIDEFLVLACDGVWDVMTNEELVGFVSARMRVTDDLETIANEVIDTCLHKVYISYLQNNLDECVPCNVNTLSTTNEM